MTPANYAAFITTVDTSIGAIYEEMDPTLTWKEYAKIDVMSGGSQKTYGWTGRAPRPRPWLGSRQPYQTAAQTYTLSPIPYESTLFQDRFQLDDSDPNQMSIFWRQLPELARAFKRQPEYECRDLLENVGMQTGVRQLGLDTLPFFSTAHPIDFFNPTTNLGGAALFGSTAPGGTGTYCNDFIGSQTIAGTVIGGALSTTSFTTLRAYGMMIPGEDGEQLGVQFDTLMVPTTLQDEAAFIVKATSLASPTWGGFSPLTGQVGAADNVLAKVGIRIVVNRALKKTQRFYFFDGSHSVKPLVWLVREAPKTVPRIQENDPIVFDSHRYTWGGWDRVAPGWGYSYLMLRSGPVGG
jgi:phage major head subunit gpT-like protein